MLSFRYHNRRPGSPRELSGGPARLTERSRKQAAGKEGLKMKKIAALLMAVLMLTGFVFAEGTEPAENNLVGGWTPAADPTVTEELQAVLDKALESLMGVHYVPVAYLGSQLVAGTNHAFLCQATVVYPDAQPRWVILYLYQDLQGNVTIMNIADFDFGSLCTYGA